MTKELIAQWVIDNRYGKSENDKVSDSEMYHKLVDEIESLIQNHGDIGDVIGLLPVGTDVVINNAPDEWGDKAGKKMRITGYCEWKKNKTGGYLLNGEGVYLNEDFVVV